MYRIVRKTDSVQIPPHMMAMNFDELVSRQVQDTFEGRLDARDGIVVLTMNVQAVGDGHIVHGSGNVYQQVTFEALVYRPEDQEVVDGIVAEIVEYGAFVHIGPLDALVHSSQIMDDFMNADVHNERIVGRESGRSLEVLDNVRCRVVSLKFNELTPRQSKIGITMRQQGLGKFEWIEEDRRKRKEGGE